METYLQWVVNFCYVTVTETMPSFENGMPGIELFMLALIGTIFMKLILKHFLLNN